MYKIVLFCLLLLLQTSAFSQSATFPGKYNQQDYLKKSKRQGKAAWLFLGGGAVLVVAGKAVAPEDYNPYYDVNTPKEDRQYHFSQALGLAGLSSMLASIPLFFAARRNKKKSMQLSFKNETAPFLSKQSFVRRSIPSLALKISL